MSEKEEVLLVSASGATRLMEVERGRMKVQFPILPTLSAQVVDELALWEPPVPKVRTYECRARRIYVYEEVE